MSRLAKTTIGLMIVSILTKVVGFFREIILASVYGISIYSDAYITSLNVPNVLFSLVGASIATTLIPIYSDINETEGENKALIFLNNITNIISIICLIISIIGIIFAEPIVKIFAIGFKGELFEITVKFTRIIFISILFIAITNILTCFLQLKGKFIFCGMIGIPLSMIIITSILISANTNLYVLPVGTLIAYLLQCILVVIYSHKKGYKYKFNLNIKDEKIKRIIYMIIPVLIGTGAVQINNIIDRTLASTLGIGTISAFNYANRLYGFVQALFIGSIITVIYPDMARLAAKNDIKELKLNIERSINVMSIFVFPIIFGTLAIGDLIVEILFKRGAFDDIAVIMTSNILKIYMIGIIAFALRDLLSKVFYVFKDTKTPMKNGIISIILNVILNIILINYLGYRGLAIATSISACVGCILLLKDLNKKIGIIKLSNDITKSFIASAIMGILVNIIYILLINNYMFSKLIVLVLCMITGILIYIIMVFILKVEELSYISKILYKKK